MIMGTVKENCYKKRRGCQQKCNRDLRVTRKKFKDMGRQDEPSMVLEALNILFSHLLLGIDNGCTKKISRGPRKTSRVCLD
jgi:hypothetical protein